MSLLSGGERRRLALAVVVASGANLLVLDEPTNHLDLESREALEAALEAFPGTVLLVSHDRALLDAVAERTVAIEQRTLRSYDGGWADLVRARDETSAAARRRTDGVDAGSRAGRRRRAAAGARPGRGRIESSSGWPSSRRSWPRTGGHGHARASTAREELGEALARWEELFESA